MKYIKEKNTRKHLQTLGGKITTKALKELDKFYQEKILLKAHCVAKADNKKMIQEHHIKALILSVSIQIDQDAFSDHYKRLKKDK